MNILPGHSEFLWEYRSLPDEEPELIIQAIQEFTDSELVPAPRKFAPRAAIETLPIARVPALVP